MVFESGKQNERFIKKCINTVIEMLVFDSWSWGVVNTSKENVLSQTSKDLNQVFLDSILLLLLLLMIK